MAAALTTAAGTITTDIGTVITAGVGIYVLTVGISYVKRAFTKAA